MAGHSKWNNIKRKKGAADAKRAAIFSKLGRELAVAVREGGPDPEGNARLAAAIVKAKASNMPNDNISRSITRAAGGGEGADYEEITYEGYGPGGVAVMVRSLTDNRNRTAGEVRHAFDKHGGNLGTNGCVSFMFQNKGVLIIERTDEMDEETVMMAALEAGAEDMETEDEAFVIYTEPDAFAAVEAALTDAGYTFAQAEIQPTPDNYIELADVLQCEHMEKLVEDLEDSDDVQDVWHNWEPAEEVS